MLWYTKYQFRAPSQGKNLFTFAGLAMRNCRHLHTSGLIEPPGFGIDGSWNIALLRIGNVLQIPLWRASILPSFRYVHVLNSY